MAQPSSGFIGLFPSFAQPTVAKMIYDIYIAGWSPFGLLGPLSESDWPHDLWEGDSDIGKPIASRRFTLAGCDISFSRHVGWYSREGSVQWLRALHRFDWMRDVLAHASGKPGGKLLRGFIWDWIASSEQIPMVAFDPDVMGARLANWIIHGRFLQQGARPPFRRKFQKKIVAQAFVLLRQMRRGEQEYGFDAVKGLLLVSLSMPHCGFLFDEAMDELRDLLNGVLHDGAVDAAMLNPAHLHHAVRSLLEIHAALMRLAEHEEPMVLEALRVLRARLTHILHGDGGFALFHGATEGSRAAIQQTLFVLASVLDTAQDPAMVVAPSQEPASIQPGYVRLQAEETAIIVDISHPAESSGFEHYYSTLAFEMSHAAQRIVVNCGAFIGNDPTWGRVVKTTAAHSTICVDDRNSAPKDLSPDHLPFPLAVDHRLVAREGYQFFEGTYNGYSPYSGLIHSRQLLVNNAGTRFSGADHLKMQEEGKGVPEPRSHDVNLRFHLHPHVTARRLMNGMVVITTEDGKQEWTFHASVGQAVELEESIYLGLDGHPVSCHQIVIYAPFMPDRPWAIEWSFIKT